MIGAQDSLGIQPGPRFGIPVLRLDLPFKEGDDILLILSPALPHSYRPVPKEQPDSPEVEPQVTTDENPEGSLPGHSKPINHGF
jgi:hypothetical protein